MTYLMRCPFHSSTLRILSLWAFQRRTTLLEERSVIPTFPSWSPVYRRVFDEFMERAERGDE